MYVFSIVRRSRRGTDNNTIQETRSDNGKCSSSRPCFCRAPLIYQSEITTLVLLLAAAVGCTVILFSCVMRLRARSILVKNGKGTPPVWFTSNFAAVEEGIRQGEAETEQRIRMEKIYRGQTGVANPLIEYYKDDPEICRLQVDKELLRGHLIDSFFHNPAYYLPCFWPNFVLCGPCTLFCYTLGLVEKKADAHTVILCKNSIKCES